MKARQVDEKKYNEAYMKVRAWGVCVCVCVCVRVQVGGVSKGFTHLLPFFSFS